MKYEGKIYGKIGGKYVHLKGVVDADEIIDSLNKLAEKCRENGRAFAVADMESSESGAMGMAAAYQSAVELIKEKATK